MRLLAYGGTRYAERARLGRWSESLRTVSSDFEDTFDIPTGQGLLSYGVGILDDAAVLILRERQNESDRGGYPYTLLLDPGVELWRRFEWNAPLVMCALRDDADLWSRLMHEPQRFSSVDVLEEQLRALTPPQAVKGTVADVGPALAASLQADHVYFPIGVIGLSTRPPIDEMARALASLPAFVRVGGGWMMGGGKNGRRSFGCRAVFDDISPSPELDDASREALEQGRRLVHLSAEVLGRPGTSDISDALADPAAAWSSAPGTVSRALAVASIAARGAIDKPSIDEIATFLSQATPYGLAVLDLWKRALTHASLSAAVSRVFLKYDWDRIDAALGDRLSIDALSDEFHSRRLTPAGGAAQMFGLTPQREAAVWTALVGRATDASEIVALAADAASRLRAPDAVRPIVQRALDRTLEVAGVLRAWTPLRQRHDVWPLISAQVTEAARSRVGSDDRWHVDYAFLGDDPGGAWLVTRQPDAVPAVVTALIDELSTPAHAEATKTWLAALAATAARSRAELSQKLQLGQRIGARWLRLVAMERICAGEPADKIDVPPLVPEEARALVVELDALLTARTHRQTSRAPLDLEALDAVFGGTLRVEDLPRSVEPLAPLTSGSIDWLARRGAATLSRELAVRTWLDGGESAVPLASLDDKGLEALVSNLFNRTQDPLDSERDIAIDLLRAAAESPSKTLMALIADAIAGASQDKQRAGRIAKLIAPEPTLTGHVLGWVETRDAGTLLQSAAEHDAAVVTRLVETFVGHVSEHTPAWSVRGLLALQEFLRRQSPAVRTVRDRAGRALFGPDAGHFAAYLDDLRRTVEMDAAASDRPHGPDFLRRVRDWLHTRRRLS